MYVYVCVCVCVHVCVYVHACVCVCVCVCVCMYISLASSCCWVGLEASHISYPIGMQSIQDMQDYVLSIYSALKLILRQ